MKKLMFLILSLNLCSFLYAQKPPGAFLDLDGYGDYLQLSNYADSLIFNGPATIEFWLKVNYDHRNDVGIIWFVSDNNPLLISGSEYFELTYGAHTGNLDNERLNIIKSIGAPAHTNFYSVIDDGYYSDEWHHYAVLITGSEYIVFIDGEEQLLTANGSTGNMESKTYGNFIDPKIDAALGARYIDNTSSFSFNGSIDEFRIWNTVRSQTQIQTTMNDTLTSEYYSGSDSGLVAYWRFDKEEDLGVGGDNPDIRDFSMHHYHGDLAGNAVVQWEQFTQINAPLVTVHARSAVWGDYDNDDDLDILLAAEIYNNDNGNFIFDSSLNGLSISSNAWGDYNNDGNLDILLTGLRSDQRHYSIIYSNSNSSFIDINAGLEGVDESSVAWGDYDNDGDLDILITGNSGTSYSTKIYRNDNGSFTDIDADLPTIVDGSVAWGDYDNDGDLDILLGEYNTVWICRNDDSTFTGNNLHINDAGPSVWGDYDNDGDLDILIASAVGKNKIYRNDKSTFINIDAVIGGGVAGSASWGDYDNDGDLDVLITDEIYRNDDSVFTLIETPLAGNRSSLSYWGDYDADGDLDILLSDYDFSRIYRNDINYPNVPPDAPVNLNSTPSNTMVSLGWDAASDAQTPSPGLTYNLRIGTTPGGCEIMSPVAGRNGYRRIAQMGNVNHHLSWQIKNLQPNTIYFWSVQAVDNSFAGGTWAEEQTFTTGITGIGNLTEEILYQFSLSQNFPNPFNPITLISYTVGANRNTPLQYVDLSIYNILGQMVVTLVNKNQVPGSYQVEWDGSDFPSGVYFYRIQAGDFVKTKRMLLIK
jgi:hypothetical protein